MFADTIRSTKRINESDSIDASTVAQRDSDSIATTQRSAQDTLSNLASVDDIYTLKRNSNELDAIANNNEQSTRREQVSAGLETSENGKFVELEFGERMVQSGENVECHAGFESKQHDIEQQQQRTRERMDIVGFESIDGSSVNNAKRRNGSMGENATITDATTKRKIERCLDESIEQSTIVKRIRVDSYSQSERNDTSEKDVSQTNVTSDTLIETNTSLISEPLRSVNSETNSTRDVIDRLATAVPDLLESFDRFVSCGSNANSHRVVPVTNPQNDYSTPTTSTDNTTDINEYGIASQRSSVGTRSRVEDAFETSETLNTCRTSSEAHVVENRSVISHRTENNDSEYGDDRDSNAPSCEYEDNEVW